jgi:hydroxyethylthiazole kinase-like uncharacterized protein yjeF
MAAALPEEQGCIAHEAVERICAMSKRVDALLLGPGMMQPDATRRVVTASLEAYEGDAAVVLDAGALVCPKDPRTLVRSLGGRVVLTPHPGEMARLLDRPRETVQSAAARLCRETAEAFNAVIALKGACTYIATPEGELFEHAQGCVGLATSGSGDTLSGIIAGLLARGASPAQATIWSVYLHGAAGRRLEKRHGLLGFLARELLDEIPAIMNGLGQSSRG